MPFISNSPRARVLILFALFATIISFTLFASPLFNPARAAGNESVQVFAGDCATPKTIFFLGDTVCVKASDFPLHPTAAEYYRRINWSAPNLGVAESELVKADPDFYKFVIPSSGPFAQPGKWRVQTVDIETNGRASANFTVRNPRHLLVDLSIWKTAHDYVLPGDKLRYTLTVRNPGPELAEFVQFVDDVPSNATFLALRQRSGPLFECATPKEFETGRILCTTKFMKLDEEATFDVFVVVDEQAREGDTLEGRTQVASNTEDLEKFDNTAVYATRIVSFLKEEPPPVEELENSGGYEGEKVPMPAPEKENPFGYEGEKVPMPEPEPVNSPDYKGEKVPMPEPEPENPFD